MADVASPWQTVLLAVVGALIPFGSTLAAGGQISWKTAAASAVTSALAAFANWLRSPKQDPPTLIPTKGQ